MKAAAPLAAGAEAPASTSGFRPAWWLPGAHAQTLWAALGRRPAVVLRPERLELPDGDFVDLCWTRRAGGPVVAVFHGLEGCARSAYARGILAAVDAAGWRGVLMHFRGCSGDHNRLDRSYHSGDTGDIRYLMQTLAQREPRVPLAAVGYSLGGNALLKYLAEGNTPPALRAAAAVSVPFLLDAGARRLERGLSRFYQWYLLRRLRRRVLDKFRDRRAPVPLDAIHTCRTFYQFDDHITAPLHGFRDADDYYTRASSRPSVAAIRVPTLLLHAADDPFMTPEVVPDPSGLPDNVRLEQSAGGGHVGFVGGPWPWRPEYWLDRRIPQYLRDHLE